MTADKRNPDFAYLRHNLFASKEAGLYPSVDFVEEQPNDTPLTTAMEIYDIVGTEEDGFDTKVFVENSGDIDVYNLGSNTLKVTLAGRDYECGCFGDDGIHFIADNDHVYRPNHLADTISDIGTLPSGSTPEISVFDGLHYWYLSRDEIYKQLADDAPTIAFNDIGMIPRFAAPFNNELVIFCQTGNSIYVFFWDKSDTDLFTKRIVINNAKLIAGGVVDGKLMLVKSIGNSSNEKERDGEIVVSRYNGEAFVSLNSIKAAQDDVRYEHVRGVGVGNEVMLVSLSDNTGSHNTTLYKNFVLKIRNDGSIETQQIGRAHV